MKRTSLLFQLCFGWSAKLYSYEHLAIAAVRQELKIPTSKKFEEQLRFLPYRQRQDHDRIVAFFPERNNLLPEELLFNNAREELMFATVELRTTIGQNGVLTARFYAAARRFFSIDYDDIPNAKGIKDGTGVSVISVKLIADPDLPCAYSQP
jgi:hypothetical protein